MDLLLNPGSRQEKQIEAEKHFIKIGSMLKRSGLSLWSLDTTTGKVSKCELGVRKMAAITKKGEKAKMSRFTFTVQPNREYLQALNAKNAIRKFKALQAKGFFEKDLKIQ